MADARALGAFLLNQHQMDSQRRPLSAPEESQFQTDMADPNGPYGAWRQQFLQRYNEQPNYNDPQYDYRTAWRYGVTPQPYAPDNNFPHWYGDVPAAPFAEPLPLKSPDHPTRWMSDMMSQTGIDPNAMTSDQAFAALQPRMQQPFAGVDPSLGAPWNAAAPFISDKQ